MCCLRTVVRAAVLLQSCASSAALCEYQKYINFNNAVPQYRSREHLDCDRVCVRCETVLPDEEAEGSMLMCERCGEGSHLACTGFPEAPLLEYVCATCEAELAARGHK